MKNEKPENKKPSEIPDFADESFWQDFSRELWVALKQTETSMPPTTADNLPRTVAENDADKQPEAPKMRRSENCLSFARCAEIGKDAIPISPSEKTHLNDCGYCGRRIEKLSVLKAGLQVASGSSNPAVKENSVKVEKNAQPWFGWLFPFNKNSPNVWFDWLPVTLSLASVIILLMIGAGILFLYPTSKSAEKTEVFVPNDNAPKNSSANINAPQPPVTPDLNTENKSAQQNSVNTDQVKTGGNSLPVNPKIRTESASNINKESESNINLPADKSSAGVLPDLAAVEQTDVAAVREALINGKIRLPADVEKMTQRFTSRGAEDVSVNILSPKNKAVSENAPVFSWENAKEVEFQVTVTDLAKREVAKSEVLTQNTWRIPQSLPSGFYLWEISARKQGESAFTPPSRPIIFKILSETEKTQIARIKNNKSNLVRAVIYARAGLFAEAEKEINAELKKNPQSPAAQKMLKQVQSWQK